MLKKAQDIGRVRRNIYMLGATVIAGIIMILIGRHQWRQGHGIRSQELYKMQQLREEGIREAEANKTNNK